MIDTKSLIALAAAILLQAAAAAAQADAPPGGQLPPGNDASLRDTPSIPAPGEAPLVPGAKDPTDGDFGEHQVTGKVEAIDRQAGTVSIDVKGKDVKILFPPTALAHLDQGDEVTVRMSLQKSPAAGTNP
ncbi:MAG: hypothetical protein AB1689_24340 [Thermodesulfobacteriota bacterium]